MDWILVTKIGAALALLLTGLLVFWQGGSSERVAFSVMMVAAAATGLMAPLAKLIGSPARFGYVAIDALTLVAFDAIMIRTRRAWPIWIAGIQMASVCLGAALLIDPARLGEYRLIQGKFAYPILLALALGSRR